MNLKLEKVWEHTKIRLGDNTTIVKEIYEIGHYEVERTTETYEDATTKEWFRTGRDTAAEFIPEIDFQSDPAETPESEFVVITPGRWTLTAKELEQLIAGYQEALDVVRILTEAFIKRG